MSPCCGTSSAIGRTVMSPRRARSVARRGRQVSAADLATVPANNPAELFIRANRVDSRGDHFSRGESPLRRGSAPLSARARQLTPEAQRERGSDYMARQGLVRAMRACVAIAAMAVLLVPASADAARYAKRTLKQGSQGSDVKLLQKYLVKAGYRTKATGYYGSMTKAAEKRSERARGRRADGKASRKDQRIVRKVARVRAGGSAGTGGSGYQAPEGNAPARARLSSNGRPAIAPDNAPPEVKRAIAAANRITRKPYKWGGGHGQWEDSGYDCSGAVSYAMHGAGILKRPRDSTGFMGWGKAGKGRWITVYANSGHAYTVIAGLRFDTSAAGAGGGSGPRWRTKPRSSSGYTVRHPTRF